MTESDKTLLIRLIKIQLQTINTLSSYPNIENKRYLELQDQKDSYQNILKELEHDSDRNNTRKTEQNKIRLLQQSKRNN